MLCSLAFSIAIDKYTMQGHGLRRVFHTAENAKPAIVPQWVVRRPVARGGTVDAHAVPAQYGIEQAHRLGMRDQASDGGFADQHGATAISREPPL